MGIISREEFYLRAGFRLTPQKKVQGTTSVEELMQEIKYDAKHRSHSFLFNRTWDYDCQSVKDNCDYYPDDCYFSVENNIVGEYGKNKLYQYFDGRCYCHINRDYKNMILDK